MSPLRTLTAALLLAAPLSAGCQSTPKAAAASVAPAAALPAVDSGIAQLFALDLAPGMAVVVVRDTAVIYMRGFGHADVEARRPVTPRTAFYIASTTKAFTGLAASVLHSRGAIDLDAPLSRYLPAARLRAPLSADGIPLRALLTHTHGIENNGPIVSRTAYSGQHTPALLVQLLSEHAPAATKREFVYGNVGYNVASFAMDAALKKSWKDVLQETLFDPLGMRGTSAYMSRVPRQGLAMPYAILPEGFARLRYAKGDDNMQAAGGLVSTAADMGRWLEAQINGGRVDGRQVVPAAAVAEAQRRQVAASGARDPLAFPTTGYALGWNVGTFEGEPLLHHGGGFPGFITHVSFMPGRRVGVAVLANDNSFASAVLTSFVARHVYSVLTDKPSLGAAALRDTLPWLRGRVAEFRSRVAADRARRAARPQTLPLPLDGYAGRYENALYGTIELRAVNGKLEATHGLMWSAVEAFDAQKNQLRVELTGPGTVVQANVANGRVESLTTEGVEFRRVP